MTFRCNVVDEEDVQHSRSAVMINPVDLASDKHADLTILPPLLVGQQVGDQQGQTWTGETGAQHGASEMNTDFFNLLER